MLLLEQRFDDDADVTGLSLRNNLTKMNFLFE